MIFKWNWIRINSVLIELFLPPNFEDLCRTLIIWRGSLIDNKSYFRWNRRLMCINFYNYIAYPDDLLWIIQQFLISLRSIEATLFQHRIWHLCFSTLFHCIHVYLCNVYRYSNVKGIRREKRRRWLPIHHLYGRDHPWINRSHHNGKHSLFL